MELPLVQLPRRVPVQRDRVPQENIPPTPRERERLRSLARAFIAEKRPVPPLSLSELRSLTEEFIARESVPQKFIGYAGVLVNGEMWRDQLAAVPFGRRLLLLPKCLRIEDRCPALFDEFGLLCKQCGLCSIQDIQEEAERWVMPCWLPKDRPLSWRSSRPERSTRSSESVACRCWRKCSPISKPRRFRAWPFPCFKTIAKT